jgi:uncharacterized coiled-coil protein SlyX
MDFRNLFSGKKRQQELEIEVKTLKEALSECNCKLAEKQEHINTTNAYWKKKMRDYNQPAKEKPIKTRKPKGGGSEGYVNPPLDA